MQWHKEMLRGFRDNAAYEGGRYLILALLAAAWPIINGILQKPWYWKLNGFLISVAVILLVVAIIKFSQITRKSHTPSEAEETPKRRAILTKIVDRIKRPTVTGYVDSIGALIELSDEFHDESDVVWVCKQLATHREYTDPFVALELQYGNGAFDGKRLKFLRDARISRKPIMLDSEALSYLGYSWAKNNGLRSIPWSPSPQLYPPNERTLPQSSQPLTGIRLRNECDNWIASGKAIYERLHVEGEVAIPEAKQWLDGFKDFTELNLPVSDIDMINAFQKVEELAGAIGIPTDQLVHTELSKHESSQEVKKYKTLVAGKFGRLFVIRNKIK
jgi:hypothetical protein